MTKLNLPAPMHCRSCEQRVQRTVGALDGVRSVTTDLSRQTVVVEFDEEVVRESEIHTAVAGAAAHDVGG